MFLFLYTLFPLVCADYYIRHNYDRRYLAVSLAGFFTAVVYCLFNTVFIVTIDTHTADPLAQFVHFFLHYALIPCAVLFGAFFTVAKGSIEYKCSAFMPLLASFYAVYLPYNFTGRATNFPFYILFISPVIYALMLFALSADIALIVLYFKRKQAFKIFLVCFSITISLCTPALIETIWFNGIKPLFWGAAFALYAVYICLHICRTRDAIFHYYRV